MRAFLLAGAAALALGGAALAQTATPGVIGSPQFQAQTGAPMGGGADVGRSGSPNMGSGQTTMGDSAGRSGAARQPSERRRSAAHSPQRSQRSAEMQRSGRQARASARTSDADRAYMGGGMILENGRPVGDGLAGASNAMGGAGGAIQPGPAGRVGSGNNAGNTPGGGR